MGLGVALLADAASFLVIALVLAVTRDLPAPETEAQGWLERAAQRVSRSPGSNPRVRLLLGGQRSR